MRETSQTVDAPALAADAREFAERLAETHPDPYDGHGGRVAYHRRLAELVRDIPDGGESRAAFARRLQSFAARVRDGHTSVELPEDATETVAGRLPVSWRVVGDALYADAVHDDDHADLLGGRLRAVEGVAVSDLRERVARTQSSDNAFGDRVALADALGPNPGDLAPLVDTTAPTVRVETASGDRVERTLDPQSPTDPVDTLDRAVDHPDTGGEPAYRFLDGGDTALLALPDCHSHREVVAFGREVGGAASDLYDLEDTYRRVVGDPVPDDPADALAALPAATEVFLHLADEMADASTSTLVVDTRGNGGGSSLAAYALTYALYGRSGVQTAVADQYSVSKHSPLARDQYGDTDRLEPTDDPAGFDFSEYFRDTTARGESVLDELATMSDIFADALDRDAGGRYEPDDVVVVTNAETFSAGVEPGVLLSKLGATVVGVPSAQAANGPRDVLYDTLPETGLGFRVSYRHHVFQPGRDGTVFEPDTELLPGDFESMGRPADAGVLVALDATDA
jgi:hypothetical protein